jgi:hypothetical protein
LIEIVALIFGLYELALINHHPALPGLRQKNFLTAASLKRCRGSLAGEDADPSRPGQCLQKP